jgi:hypothetical protein
MLEDDSLQSLKAERSPIGFRFRKAISSERCRAATLLLLLGLLVCIAFFNSPGTADVRYWMLAMDMPRHHPLFASYPLAANDYPPLSIVFLGCLGRMADIFQLNDFFVLKLSLTFFTLVCAGIMASWQGHWQPILGVAAFFVLVLDSVLLVYIDVYFAAFLLVSFFLLERGHLGAGAAFFALSVFVKWQPIVVAPFVVLYLLPKPFNPSHLRRLVPAIIVVLVVYLIFGNATVYTFYKGITDTIFSHAFNLNWLITAFIRTQANDLHGGNVEFISFGEYPLLDMSIYPYLSHISTTMRYVTYAVTICYFYYSKRTFQELVQASIVAFMCYFIFGSLVHENHALLPSILGLCWAAMDRSRYLEATLLAVIFNMNMLIFYGISGKWLGFSRVVGWDVTIFLSAFNIVVFAILWLPIAATVASNLLAILKTKSGTLAAATGSPETKGKTPTI